MAGVVSFSACPTECQMEVLRRVVGERPPNPSTRAGSSEVKPPRIRKVCTLFELSDLPSPLQYWSALHLSAAAACYRDGRHKDPILASVAPLVTSG